MLRKLLFFSKYDRNKMNEMEKLHSQSLEIQKIMYEEIKKISSEISKNEKNQEAILQKCSFLLEKQKRDNENIYGIINQLLLKDLLKTYKKEIETILNYKK